MAIVTLPANLGRELQLGGFYPDVVSRVLSIAIAGEEVSAYLVHPETSFDTEVYRHLTALVLTPTRLISAHVDDEHAPHGPPRALATTHSVPLNKIDSVVLTHVMTDPARKRPETDELTIVITWGSNSRIDLDRAGCSDPNCEVDHGLTGVLSGDDLLLRISTHADGAGRLEQAVAFAGALSRATAA